MSFGDSIDDADEILTLIAMLPVAVVILIMALNFGNPDFDTLGYFEIAITMWAKALIPSIGLILVLAGLIHVGKQLD
jgi:hypothetical protein